MRQENTRSASQNMCGCAALYKWTMPDLPVVRLRVAEVQTYFAAGVREPHAWLAGCDRASLPVLASYSCRVCVGAGRSGIA